MATTIAVLSFRLGEADGVSVVAANWQRVLDDLGYRTYTVAGEGTADVMVPGLGIRAEHAPAEHDLAAALAAADVVLVENLLSIPLNLTASAVAARVLHGRPAVLHHHDPPWQRPRFATVTDLPVDDRCWRHVTINRLTERQFAARGFAATTIYNGFDVNPPTGDRATCRAALDIGDEPLVVHPVRAIARKNIPAALEIAERLEATYLLTGPAEEGFGPELSRLLDAARCRVVHRPIERRADLFAAADLVVFPSTWEGFGNPPIEASIHRRPVAVSRYPVAEELRQLGFDWLEPDDWPSLAREIAGPDADRLERNHRVACSHMSLDALRHGVELLLATAGWGP